MQSATMEALRSLGGVCQAARGQSWRPSENISSRLSSSRPSTTTTTTTSSRLTGEKQQKIILANSAVKMLDNQRRRQPKQAAWPPSIGVLLALVAFSTFIAQVDCNNISDSSLVSDDDDHPSVERRLSLEQMDRNGRQEHNQDDQAPLEQVDDQMLSTKQPRQQFRIHLGPSQSLASKRSLKMSLHNRRAVQQPVDRPPADSADQKGSPQAKSAQQHQKKKPISSAALKKLLSQSLNGSSNAIQHSPKGPNFKFVFIKRATVAPLSGTKSATSASGKPTTSSISSTTTSTSTSTTKTPAIGDNSSSGSGGIKSKTAASPPSSQTQQYQSLAASISKQLASSLLYSAANLMVNLTAPSISTLASQQNHFQVKNSSSSSSDDDQDKSANDIRRIQTAPTKTTTSTTTSATGPSKSQRPTTIGGKKTRPSKVYNLPLKFVSNGQPNSVMFHTIRQHFATIKKLQSMAQPITSIKSSSSQSASSDKRRKQPGVSKMHNRLKGTNSRLIYLPLKYLSNARSTGIISTKASHKLLKSSSKND